ncbi:Quinone oxidoreductase 1 [Corynebacterium heidelbergense]|nr:NAD(P)H-quinone oxidoreductase [Corynebacterium heidelbergense]WCZ37557.1 Quinone oxidoreductase 1 [Corynebacterium heidelbergense]
MGTLMHAIRQAGSNGPSSLHWGSAERPRPADGEALVRITHAGVNRADTLQAQGHYPPPPGVTDILGLEGAGLIEDPNNGTRPDGTPWKAGDEVAFLLSGGGYAEYAAVPHGQLLPIPAGFSLEQAASVVEVACTVWSNICMTAHLREGQRILFHGGGGGIGLFGLQLAKALGATVATTAGSAEKLATCQEYGADILINYREEDFAGVLARCGGVDVILDIIGAKYLARNIDALAPDGHLVIIGMQGGVRAELPINKLLAKRGNISATGLRYRDREDKARVVRETVSNVWPMLEDGRIRCHIDRVIPAEQAAAAHRALLSGEVTGKIVLKLPEAH